MAFLSVETSNIIRDEVDAKVLQQTGRTVREMANVYRAKGLNFTRFMWDMYHTLGDGLKTRILADRNPHLEMVGGYFTNLKDVHLDTMLKRAFSDCKYS